MFAGHLDLAKPLAWTVENALPPERCEAYIRRFHAATPEQAPVITERGTEIDLAVRNNARVMWDDAAEADALVALVRETVPATWNGEQLAGGNPRIRIYRYEPGEHHSAHWDTVVELGDGIASRITLVFYLNDGFGGGETEFPELGKTVTPKRGTALLFQHRVLHAARGVTAGVKYALRTDILYRRAP